MESVKKERLEALERRLSSTPPSTGKSSPAFRPRSHDGQGTDASYAKLCPSVVNSPLCTQLQLRDVTDTGAALNDVVKGLLDANAKFTGDVGGTIEARMQDSFILLDNPVTQSGATERARERARLGRSKRSKKHFSLRKHRELGSYDLPPEFQKHSLYKPLQEMWESYVKDLLANCSESMVQSRLLMADLHGAILAVVNSKNLSYIGVQGIMVRETEKTFGIITSNDKFRVVPKEGSTFRMEVMNMGVTLFGNGLELRSRKQSKK